MLVGADDGVDCVLKFGGSMHIPLSIEVADLLPAAEGGVESLPPAEGEVVGAQVVSEDLLPAQSITNIHILYKSNKALTPRIFSCPTPGWVSSRPRGCSPSS